MKVKITIGDWSVDGHGISDEFVFESNKTLKEIQDAYRKSRELLGLKFDCNEKLEGIDWKHPEHDDRQVCVEYQSSRISDLAIAIFNKHGIEVSNYPSDEEFTQLMIDVIKLSLPDLVLTEAAYTRSELKTIPAVNGWWGELNIGWGYGLYE